jgi:hypothetical protein
MIRVLAAALLMLPFLLLTLRQRPQPVASISVRKKVRHAPTVCVSTAAPYIKSPQLNATANTVAFDYVDKQITAVRAQGSVNLKMNLVPRGGGTPARVETTSNSATLDPVKRVLVLSGNVNGFYQLTGGPRNTLRGTRATITYLQEDSSTPM